MSEIQPIKLKLKNVKNDDSMKCNIDNNNKQQSIVIESDNSSQNDILNDNKTKTQKEIDDFIEKLQEDEQFQKIKDGDEFKNIKKNKENAFYKLTNLLKNKENQQYFLSLCEQGTTITFTLFTRILQECSFVEEYIKLNNALVLNYYDDNNINNNDDKQNNKAINDDNNISNNDYKQNNKVIIFNNKNIDNKSLKNIFQKINNIEIINHPESKYGLLIGNYRKKQPLPYSNKLQVFTYNSPSNWFYPTIYGSEQRATAQSELLSKIINCTQENNDIYLSMNNMCSGNYFGFDLLKKALQRSDDKKKIYLKEIQMQSIMENGLFHMGAEDIARKFIELIEECYDKGIYTNTTTINTTTINFRHEDDFFHKNGCKQFADALTTILNSDKEKYKNVIKIINDKKKISFENTEAATNKEEYFDEQLDYFEKKLKAITDNKPVQNTTTIHNARKNEDKVYCCCCCCCGVQ